MNPETIIPSPGGPWPQPFGRYELRAALSGGGMGRVYLAFDTNLRQEVALKVPHPDLVSDPVIGELFLEEARSGVRLRHANICRVLDLGRVGDTPYLTMEFVHGVPLSACRPTGDLWWGPWEAAALVHTLAGAMAEAHKQGIIHRDLKPQNVMIRPGPDREPVIVNLGLALDLGSRAARVPRPGSIEGTIEYMSPEQLTGTAPVGPYSDVYSLGVIFYELLTGVLPFPAKDRGKLLEQVLNDTPPPPSERRPGVPPILSAICLKAMARDVKARYRGMEELRFALGPVVIDMTLTPLPDSPPSARPAPRLRREQVRFAFAGFGERPASLAGRNRLFLDVGNDLRAGVIDHHRQLAFSGSATSLVRNRPDLVEASVAADLGEGDDFVIVLHQSPDLDCVASTYLALALLTTGRFPEGDDLLARYVDAVDEGSIGMGPSQPYSLYAAFRQLVERSGTGEANWRTLLDHGLTLIDFALRRAVREQRSLTDVDAFDCPGLFRDEERAAVRDDRDRYRRKLADPATMARVARLRLPGQFGGKVEVEALLVRDVQNEGDPDRCLYFKDWARSDAQHARNHRGFEALAVFMTENVGQRRSCILSVTPRSNTSMRGLGALIDEAEAVRRRATHGRDDRRWDPVTGEAKPAREGYDNSDPWYDGRAHGYTIVDAPRGGTHLTAEQIEGLFLEYGGAGNDVKRLVV